MENDLTGAEKEEEFLNASEVAEVVEFNDNEEGDHFSMDGEDIGSDAEPLNDAETAHDDSVQCFSGHRDSVYCVAVHPTLPLVATGGGDDFCLVWDLQTAECVPGVADMQHNTDSVTAVAFSHDGRYLASGAMDGKVTIFEISGPGHVKVMHLFTDSAEITWLRWHSSAHFLVAGSSEGVAYMWRVDMLKLASVLSGGHVDNISCGQFTPSGKNVVTAGEEGNLCKWQVSEGASSVIKKWTSEDRRWHQAPITSMDIDSHSVLALTGDQDGRLCMVNLSKGDFIRSFDVFEDSIESVSINSVLGLVVTACADGTLQFHDIERDLFVRSKAHHDGAVVKTVWLKSRPLLLSCSSDGSVCLWHGKTFQLLKKFRGHTDAVLDFALTSDENYCITAGDDNTSLAFSLSV